MRGGKRIALISVLSGNVYTQLKSILPVLKAASIQTNMLISQRKLTLWICVLMPKNRRICLSKWFLDHIGALNCMTLQNQLEVVLSIDNWKLPIVHWVYHCMPNDSRFAALACGTQYHESSWQGIKCRTRAPLSISISQLLYFLIDTQAAILWISGSKRNHRREHKFSGSAPSKSTW